MNDVIAVELSEDVNLESNVEFEGEVIDTGDVDLSKYVKKSQKIAGVDLENDITVEELQEALGINNEAPEVKTDTVGEILEFSQTAIPKTFDWEQGYLNSSAVESDSTLWYRSDFVEVDSTFYNYLLANNNTATSQNIAYWLFDENKTLIGSRNILVIDAHTQKEWTVSVTGAKYIRFCIPSSLKDCLIRFYCKEQITHATKKELRNATYGNPRNLSMLDYFGANKKVVLIGDSFTQGLGSSEYVLSTRTDENGNNVTLTGNYPEYGIEHNLPQYEIGKKLHTIEGKVWYEAIDGNGYAHRLKNYLQNKFGCTVKNYGMSGITSGRLLAQEMTSETSELVTSSEGTVRVFQGLTKGFDTVFITIGGNDRGIASIDAFVYNLNWIVNYLINTDHKKVILMSMTPCENDGEMPHPMSEIDEKIQGIAETYDIPFVSCYRGMLDYCEKTGVDITTLRKSDGLHPNDEGYAVVESIVCEQLGISEVDKNYVDSLVGDIDTALDELHAYAQGLISGGVTE